MKTKRLQQKFLLIIMCLFIGSSVLYSTSHDKYHFTYDGSGNRILKWKTSIVVKSIDTTRALNTFDENIAINIYPNPTSGTAVLTISSLPEESTLYYIVSDATGKELLSQNGLTTENSLHGIKQKKYNKSII